MHLIRIIFFSCVIFLFPFALLAQKQGNTWFFGNKAGLDFNTLNAAGHPTFLLNGQLTTSEGCTSYSDAQSGKLLFYSDGIRLYDAKHTLITSQLKGSNSSSQSALGIQSPVDPTVFYLFVMDATFGGNNQDFTYSILRNVTPAGGITIAANEFNVQLYGDPGSNLVCGEKLTAVADGQGGYWIVIKEHSLSGPLPNYVFFRLGNNGQLSLQPVSKVQAPFYSVPNLGEIGMMKFSPEGKYFAITNDFNKCELYDFNASTGALSNLRLLDINAQRPYGLEFSPDGTKLYMCSEDLGYKLYQFDLKAGTGTAADIQNSRVLITSSTSDFLLQMQLGTNQKIYLSPYPSCNYLDCIEDPNASGMACMYKKAAVMLDSRPAGVYSDRGTEFGLPGFVTSFFSVSMSYTIDGCGYTASFVRNAGCQDPTALFTWDFGDGTNSNAQAPTHTYMQDGTYKVVMTVVSATCNERLEQTLTIKGIFKPERPSDINVCGNSSEEAGIVPRPNTSYTWSPPDGLSSISAANPTLTLSNTTLQSYTKTYYLRQDSAACTQNDTVEVRVLPYPRVTLGDDITICDGASITLKALGQQGYTYSWHDSKSGSSYVAQKSGEYIVHANDGSCTGSDTLLVELEYCGCGLFIPNAFSPNDDNLNETFAPKSECEFYAYDFAVYDRWGNFIFRSYSTGEGWDGKINGHNAQQDVYIFELNYKLKKGERNKVKRGRIVLVR